MLSVLMAERWLVVHVRVRRGGAASSAGAALGEHRRGLSSRLRDDKAAANAARAVMTVNYIFTPAAATTCAQTFASRSSACCIAAGDTLIVSAAFVA